MFLFRLKNEFAENRKLVLALWIILGITVWSFFRWWGDSLGNPDSRNDGFSAFSVLGVCVLAFFLLTTLFKRDDLKHPQEFWVTRPIRSSTFFGAKLVFAWLVIAFPSAVLMAVVGFIAGVGVSAVWNGLEMMLWVGCAANLLALSCMAHPGNRGLIGALCYLGGLIVPGIVLSNRSVEGLLRPYWVGDAQRQWNVLVMLAVLNVWFGWRCWRLIRDKHTPQRPLGLAALGVLTVLVIGFIPVPGGLSLHAMGESSRTMPAATVTRWNPDAIMFGNESESDYVSVQMELTSVGEMKGTDWGLGESDLRVIGDDHSKAKVGVAWLHHQKDVHGIPGATIMMEYKVFSQKLGISGRSSSRTNLEDAKVIAGLPRRKVRIEGTITLNQFQYRTLVRGPLDQPLAYRGDGIACAFTPPSSRSFHHEAEASWIIFSPSLLTSRPYSNHPQIRFRLVDPMRPGTDWLNQLNGGNMGGGTFFGTFHSFDLRVSDREIESNFFWEEIRRNGYTKSVQEWKKEATIVCEILDRLTPVVLPVDVEVEVPDPDKVRAFLLGEGL